MSGKVRRQTVDLDAYPDLVVIYLGMRVNTLTGLKTLFGFGPRIEKSVAARPDGLLQYWRDFESLEKWSRSEPHRLWWQEFLRNSGGTGFWHETYFRRGGIEAIYDDITTPVGMMRFAGLKNAAGPMFSSRQRAGLPGTPPPPAVSEKDV
ncbi:MAG TPA: DUF4188 domain-containing protein [Terriglobia bacterium]|jgi:hypothetical protein